MASAARASQRRCGVTGCSSSHSAGMVQLAYVFMAGRLNTQTMKMLLDFGPIVLFFISYRLGGIYVATGVLLATLYAALAIDRLSSGKRNRVLLLMALVATVLGGLTFAVHDPAFIKLKPTIIYCVFAMACIASHFFGKQVLMERLM